MTEPVTLELIEPDKPAATALVERPTSTPDYLLQVAVERGADLAYVEKLMDLKERHEANVARQAYNEAFAAFKAEAVQVLKNRAVTDGPLKGKHYAELHSVVNAVTPALSRHGLGASWRLTKDEKDWIEVTCTLKHALGHAETVSMGGPPDSGGAKNVIQARASVVSYLERYTLKAICGVAEQEEDDDGSGSDKRGRGSDITELLAALRATASDASARDFWIAHRDELKGDRSYDDFKDAVVAHRQSLKGATR